jgi:hypothetical protein
MESEVEGIKKVHAKGTKTSNSALKSTRKFHVLRNFRKFLGGESIKKGHFTDN